MFRLFFPLVIVYIVLPFSEPVYSQDSLFVRGLQQPVEIITDVWGIPHIYAKNQRDLFFAQGYYAASDRLFQFEIWRRQATGTVSEMLGLRELDRDIGTRLFRFRGDIRTEMNHYHPDGEEIITSYVNGVNAYIDQVLEHSEQLPLEFRLLNILPGKWTPEVVISRHQGLLGNIEDELKIARAVAMLGETKVEELIWFHPKNPSLIIDEKIDTDLLFDDVLGLYEAYRTPVKFLPEDITAEARNNPQDYLPMAVMDDSLHRQLNDKNKLDLGSNNWVIDGTRSESGYPIMANDPHRRQSVPSLRYMAHLVAPGWNVIGGGEPEIPGISIGHNEHGAWGLTVFETDAEDLYVYQLNPEDPNQYFYRGIWEDMVVIEESIPVRDLDPVTVELKYTRHGPVTYIDSANHVAYAVRCGWLEPGGSPYLASLRMNQSKNFDEFRRACHYSHIPGENMVWADREGNIGWQAVGIAPIRRNWSGLVPVPGDGSYEWEGYLPIMQKPNSLNPEEGFIITANENVTQDPYEHWDAIGFTWADPYRSDRIREVLMSGRQHSLRDMADLQTDYLSIPARQIVPFLLSLEWTDPLHKRAIEYLDKWDYYLEPGSVAAGIYHAFEEQLRIEMKYRLIPAAAHPYLSLQMKTIIENLWLPGRDFGTDPLQGRDFFLKETFLKALDKLSKKIGDNMEDWIYGQEAYKHILLQHPLSNAVSPEIRKKLDVGPASRGGNSYTVNNTSSSDNQSSGASFRMIVDTGNWDHCIGINSPGQSGDPDHPHYDNLFSIWSDDSYFPVFFSRLRIEGAAYHTLHLFPD